MRVTQKVKKNPLMVRKRQSRYKVKARQHYDDRQARWHWQDSHSTS